MKKVVSSLVASVVAVSTALSSVGVFAKADDETPKIYVDLVYETDTQIRADVIFENVPKTRSGGFHLKIANGWSVDSMENTIGILTNGCTGKYFTMSGTLYSTGSNDAFICYASSRSFDIDANGRFCSFYLNKTSSYSESNSNISAYFAGDEINYDSITSFPETGGCIHHFKPGSNEPIRLPIITRVKEYRIGDTDADGYVNASDATDVLVALRMNGGAPLKVSQIENNYVSYFPHATAPAAGDANCDGIISKDDANYILENYGSSSTGGGYIGNIGSKAIYEYYNG